MEWTKHAIWWHLYPLGFTGAPVHGWDGESQSDLHRLNRIEKWLDYALELGASGIALGPIFESEKHGYDTTSTMSTVGSAPTRISIR
jgi:cyclomaltodextrinase